MNQQMFAAIFSSGISTCFGALILMYIVRTFMACVLENPNDHGFIPASSSEVKAEISTGIAIRADLLAE